MTLTHQALNLVSLSAAETIEKLRELATHVGAIEELLKAKGVLTELELNAMRMRICSEVDQIIAKAYDEADERMQREDPKQYARLAKFFRKKDD